MNEIVCLKVYHKDQFLVRFFQVFINDIFHFVQNRTIYNYANNNTVLYSDNDIDKVVKSLEADNFNQINWFSILLRLILKNFRQ